MNKLNVVGKREPMLDALEKATGQARFTDDLSFPGMLFGKVLRSPHPHAKVLDVDLSGALKIKGVRGAISGKDIPKKMYGIVPMAKDEYALAIDKVRYIGDDVASVIAISPDVAEEAISKIRVDYEVLPAVFDPLEAMKPGAPIIHDNVPNNASATIRKEFGNVEKAFSESDFVFEDTFQTQAINHCPIEPQAAIAVVDYSGKVTLWSSTQIPFFLRRNLATTLDIPESKVRVIKPKVGGGFGQKIDLFAKDFCAAFFAMKTKKPVKFVYEREEVFTSTRQRHPMHIQLKSGMKRDGTIHAQQFRVIADGGAYNSTAPLMITLACYFIMLPYRIENLFFEGYHVYTNKPVGGAMRGHGIPQVRFAVETQLDVIAEKMGMDPLELRLKNAFQSGEPHPAKLLVQSCGFSETLIKAAEGIGWKEKRGELPFGRGVGLAGASFPSGVSNMSHISSGAIVKIERDGSITLLTGAADIGQGAETVISQIVAEELGVSLGDIRITAADTEITPLDPGTFGSGVTLRAGNAARMAAHEAKEKLFEAVAEKLEVEINELEAKDRRIYVKGQPEMVMSLQEAIKEYQYSDRPMPIIGRGSYHPPVKEPTTLLKEDGNFSPAYSFMTQAAEVAVDTKTGRVNVLNVVAAHDCGRAINPMLVEGQLEGSVVGGMGQALYEEVLTEKGQVLNPSFLDYGIPTAMEVPTIASVEVETDDPEGPFGAKESGEGTQLAPAPAIINAIYDAIGVRFKSLPVTPDKVLEALKNKKAKKVTGYFFN
ncbi:MAG: molybdopterin-dependent oxidoreductase [Thermodesulfobacteriota bacterium]|nr:molybdopterin-dependent oxidoreductase [Thermodesulfobacteriota bacterium]